MNLNRRFAAAVCAVVLPMGCHALAQTHAENVMRIDATAPAATPVPVAAQLGTARNPRGQEIGVNSQYLTFNGKPWIPVMGEFHFSRYPEAQWESEILKMKAAGVQIIATYVIWIHHEETQGKFDWDGQRDLHRFVELCGKHGMYVHPRIGPWAHAEVRNGGLPDWVVKTGRTRQNDPVYLAEVQTFYAQIAAQLKGELWKDGGPVIGIQIENEYRDGGEGKGVDHIRRLKAMAVGDGLDVPLYTVTGWDGAAIPLDSVLPVFGGYPDAPWDGSNKQLPANEVYAFRFSNRAAGSMGAIGGGGQNASSSYQGTPFLTAEVGDGTEDTYFRRPVISADDAAAIVPVMLGSGANLLGYYMFHGGRNPEGGEITLQESQVTGYPTDVPVKSYDFQAPLGEYGQEEPSLRKLKLMHYFLEDFGAQLAPMTPRAPDRVPGSPQDASVPRVSARVEGERGFLFVSNYVRHLDMAARPGFQVELKLPKGTMRVPESPIDLPAGSYGIWPVNMAMGEATLRYSTAQPFKRVRTGGQTYYFFFTVPGVKPEFFFDAASHVGGVLGQVTRTEDANGLKLVFASSGGEIPLGGGARVILMPKTQAENVWKVDDPSLLVETKAFVLSDGAAWTLQSTGEATVRMGVFGSAMPPTLEGGALRSQPGSGAFREYAVSQGAVDLHVKIEATQNAGVRAPWTFGPAVSWRKSPLPLAPDDAAFAKASSWQLTVPPVPAGLSDAFVVIRYQGDVGRLYQGARLVDDQFWNGVPWEVGLREIDTTGGGTLALKVLPLPREFPMYLERAGELKFGSDGVASLGSVEVVPQYKFVLRAPAVK